MDTEESSEGFIPTQKLGNMKLPVSDQRVNYYTLLRDQFPIIHFSDGDPGKVGLEDMDVQRLPSFGPSSVSEEKSPDRNLKKQKVAVLSWDNLSAEHNGGELSPMARLVIALSERGHQVHVFTREETGGQGKKTAGQKVRSQKPKENSIKIRGITYHALHIDSHLSYLEGAAFFSKKICEHIKAIESHEEPFKVIHCHDWQAGRAIMSLRGRMQRRIIFTPSTGNHRGTWQEDDEFLRRKDLLEQEIITLSDGILCFDQGIMPQMQKRLSAFKKKIPALIKREFNCEDYQWVKDPGEIKKKYDIFPLDPLVLFVGELNDAYGSDILVEAIPRLLSDTPSLRFLLVGEGDHLWSIRIKARYMWYEHAIRLVGHKEGKDLQELFQAADILVIPNRSNPSPFQVLAGWSSKKPVVATEAGACNLITHEENGILVKDDPESLRQGIERILSDWKKGHEIAQRGWEEVRKNYNWEAMIRKIEDFYQ